MVNKIFEKCKGNLCKNILRIFIGIVFILSAYTKFVAPGIVEIILIDHGIFSSRDSAAIFVRILIGIEFSIGILFLLNYEIKRVAIPLAMFFLIAFTVYLFYSGYVLNDNQNCGCFGEVIPMSPLESIIKNIILVAFIFLLIKLKTHNKNNFSLTLLIILLVPSIMFIVLPIKSNKNFAFRDITYFEGKGRVDLTSGEKFIVILNTECDHCQQLAKELMLLKSNSKLSSKIFALLFSEGEISVDSFKTLTGFDFPYHQIDINKFFDLIGSNPPRIYWLKDGTIKKYWDEDFVNRILNTQK